MFGGEEEERKEEKKERFTFSLGDAVRKWKKIKINRAQRWWSSKSMEQLVYKWRSLDQAKCGLRDTSAERDLRFCLAPLLWGLEVTQSRNSPSVGWSEVFGFFLFKYPEVRRSFFYFKVVVYILVSFCAVLESICGWFFCLVVISRSSEILVGVVVLFTLGCHFCFQLSPHSRYSPQ